jgi:hypothetical protein
MTLTWQKPRSTDHATAARSSLAALIEDLKEQERQTISLGSALETERAGHKEHLEDLEAAHAKELATVGENHMRQLAEAEVKHEQDLTRVKL